MFNSIWASKDVKKTEIFKKSLTVHCYNNTLRNYFTLNKVRIFVFWVNSKRITQIMSSLFSYQNNKKKCYFYYSSSWENKPHKVEIIWLYQLIVFEHWYGKIPLRWW